MNKDIHFYTNAITCVIPKLKTYKNIFNYLFGKETVHDFLIFCGYDEIISTKTMERFSRLDSKQFKYFLSPVNMNATYSYLKILKLRKKDILYILDIYRKKKCISFRLPPNKVSLCGSCKRWRNKIHININDNTCIFCEILNLK